MSFDFSFLSSIANASLIVQIVMALLLLLSLTSWFVIFSKRQTVRTEQKAVRQFEDRFWSGTDLTQLYRDISARTSNMNGIEGIFHAGFKEYARLRQLPGSDARTVIEGVQRVMRVSLHRQTDRLETRLPFLATVGSTSPYIGLFGTVWGIMNAFRSLSNVQQATLALVAPGIAEALIATAMGLFAAIPAVVAYNRYASEVDRLVGRYDIFVEEFSAVLQRQAIEG